MAKLAGGMGTTQEHASLLRELASHRGEVSRLSIELAAAKQSIEMLSKTASDAEQHATACTTR